MTKKKILVVDDEPIGQQLLQAVLMPLGYDILLAGSGEEAIKVTEEHIPNLILMDVMMPPPDGYETVKRIKSNDSLKHIPIIMVTALDDRDSRNKGLESGAIDYIAKPFDRLEIINKINNWISRTESKQNQEKINSDVKSTPIEDQKLTNTLINEIIASADLSKKFSGKLEYTTWKDNPSHVGNWIYTKDDTEYVCFFGPEQPNDRSAIKICLIKIWLWNNSSKFSLNSVDISNFIHSKINASEHFTEKEDDGKWWFTIFIIDKNKDISVSGFNKPLFIFTNNSNNEIQHINIQSNQISKLNQLNTVILLSADITSNTEISIISERIKNHMANPNINSLQTICESLIDKINNDVTFGIKLTF